MNDKEIQDEEQFFDNHIFMLTGDFQGKDSKDVGSSPKEVLDLEKLKSEQALDDATVFAITQLKENNEICKGRYKRFNRMHLKDDMLMRGEQIIVPTSMRFEIVDRVHRSMGHQGAERTREIIDKMNGSKYFSKIDMASAYWAVPIQESDRHKTAFMTPRGLLEMCVTAYGLCNSQATYQRIIDNVTEGRDARVHRGFLCSDGR